MRRRERELARPGPQAGKRTGGGNPTGPSANENPRNRVNGMHWKGMTARSRECFAGNPALKPQPTRTMQPPLPLNPTPADNQKDNRKDNQAKKSGGLPLPVVLGGALVLALIGVAALVFIVHQTRSDVARLERERTKQETIQAEADIGRQKAEHAAKLDQARARQEEVLLTARNATNALDRLLAGANRLRSEAEALKSSEAGRLVAQHSDLVHQARQFLERDLPVLPTDAEIITRIEAARRVEQQLLESGGTVFEPPSEMSVSMQEARAWADQRLEQLRRGQDALSALIGASTYKVPAAPLTASSPNLQQEIRRLSEAEAAAWQAKRAATNQSVSAEGLDRLVKAEAEKLKQQYEAELDEANRALAAANAKLVHERSLHAASNRVTAAKTDTEVARTMDEAERLKLLRKSEDPAILAKLKPFTTPGYWQPRGKAFERQPISYSQLQSVGALNKDARSLQQFVDVMWTKNDDERPRVRIGATARSWDDTSAGIDRITEIRNLIIELGPTLVEQGKLAK